MANRYTWSDANSHNYKTGNYNGVAGSVTPLSRKTIADGNLLNSDIVEVFSSRDKYLLDSLNATDASARSVYKTVEDNSAKNWANSAITGFNAIRHSSTTEQLQAYSTSQLDINVKHFNVSTDANGFTISALTDFNDSYYNKTTTTPYAKNCGNAIHNAFGYVTYDNTGTDPYGNAYHCRSHESLLFNTRHKYGKAISFFNSATKNALEERHYTIQCVSYASRCSIIWRYVSKRTCHWP